MALELPHAASLLVGVLLLPAFVVHHCHHQLQLNKLQALDLSQLPANTNTEYIKIELRQQLECLKQLVFLLS